ncbi:MAG: pyridoxamine 5'-phosphate oxidase family protein [Anaerolineae bacterium]|nr:pyridoxamine 5'-phosphate oxidase family protein [Anaerolineae bacterium]
MAKFYESISDDLQKFILKQQMFFVATAPLSAGGHVNLSPKGQDSFRILSPNRVAYLDLTGSGNETSAHLLENGRITFMFCAFEGPPNILRLYGEGRTILPDTPEWGELSPLFTLIMGARQIIVANIHMVQTSCGYAVPFYDFKGERDQLLKWSEHRGEEGLATYWQEKNLCSIDKLPTALGEGGGEERP